jgi:hypothetical protein
MSNHPIEMMESARSMLRQAVNCLAVVPFRNSALMRQALEAAGVTVRQVNIVGGGHFPPFPPDEPDPFFETVRCFDEHLGAGAAQ